MGAHGKLRTVENGHTAFCFGCEEYHLIPNTWQFNADYERPTFAPSLLIQGYSEKFKQDFVCHSFITDGEWRYCGDCTHDLCGQVVPLRSEDSA